MEESQKTFQKLHFSQITHLPARRPTCTTLNGQVIYECRPSPISPPSLSSSMLPTATAVATATATHLLFWLRLLYSVRGRSLYLISPTHRLVIGVIKGAGVTNHEAVFASELGTWNGHITIGVVQRDADA